MDFSTNEGSPALSLLRFSMKAVVRIWSRFLWMIGRKNVARLRAESAALGALTFARRYHLSRCTHDLVVIFANVCTYVSLILAPVAQRRTIFISLWVFWHLTMLFRISSCPWLLTRLRWPDLRTIFLALGSGYCKASKFSLCRAKVDVCYSKTA